MAGLLDEKRVLVVDDEQDVLETVEELLPMCHLSMASTFEEGKKLLEAQPFDIAILDIMGVEGYKLLDMAKKKGVVPIMLTAHALSVEDTVKSFKRGAASYLPKDKMSNLVTFLQDVLEAREKGRPFWSRWLERLEDYYDKRFGSDWKEKDKDFWDNFNYPSRWT